MKALLHISVLSFLLVAASSRCFALMGIENVTKTRAKALGVTFRSNIDGENGTATALSQQDPKLPSGEEVLAVIKSFAKSPLSAEGKIAAATIVTFAEKSHDVTVIIFSEVAPWLKSATAPKFSDTLLAAYVAGNVKSQLERHEKANDSYAGVLQVLKTYAQLKEADKTLDIPEVQKLVDLEAKKQLKKYVDEAVKKAEKKPEK